MSPIDRLGRTVCDREHTPDSDEAATLVGDEYESTAGAVTESYWGEVSE